MASRLLVGKICICRLANILCNKLIVKIYVVAFCCNGILVCTFGKHTLRQLHVVYSPCEIESCLWVVLVSRCMESNDRSTLACIAKIQVYILESVLR